MMRLVSEVMGTKFWFLFIYLCISLSGYRGFLLEKMMLADWLNRQDKEARRFQ